MAKKLNHSIEKSSVGYAIYDYPYSKKIYTLSARKKNDMLQLMPVNMKMEKSF